MARPLRTSERASLPALSDAASGTMAVALAMWTWSPTAGFAYSIEFVRNQAWRSSAVPIWGVALSPTRQRRRMLR